MTAELEQEDLDHPEVDPALLELHEVLEFSGQTPIPEGATGEAIGVDVFEGEDVEGGGE